MTIGSALQLPVPAGEAGAARTDYLEALRRRSAHAIDRATAVVRDVVGDVHPVAAHLWEGPPIPALLEIAAGADLVVLGDKGLGESPESAAGSVTSAMISYGKRPVAVVSAWGGAEETLGAGPIVIGVDGSPYCEAALAFALAEADVREAELLVVHAWSDIPLTGLGTSHLEWDSIQEREDAALAETLAGWQDRYPDVRMRREVVHDRPVRHLLLQADGAQLLVVGHRGRGGFTGMMVGSTSQALLHSAPCPLVVVRDHAGA